MKPVPMKNYGSIGHLPNSRLGTGDHHINKAQADILTEKTRDHKDLIIVQEKLDGANVGVLRQGDEFIAISRKGHRCIDSNLEQMQMFARWVRFCEHRFFFLEDGERIVGEWIAMAHGTKYKTDTPFIAFDLMRGSERKSYLEFLRVIGYSFPIAKLLHIGGPISVKKIEKMLDKRQEDGTYGYHGALEPVEGAVWRVEREGKVDFLAKYVRQFKEDGKYFNEDTEKLVWNWRNEE